ncbi:MAG: molybdopterin-guanine dinucleotide biosynthesis protein B [Methanotrichaceae archaeon]|nr:molybdopterin-guanine dinucleotide biosynthesis protein B [Methanotrichaceae archaeon]
MKVVAVVGTKKTGKTTLVEILIKSLRSYGRVGTIKNMQAHPVDKGDTRKHFEAGAEIVIGLGDRQIKITRRRNLQSALAELQKDGIDFVVIEGFKYSSLPKIVLGGIDVPNTLRHITIKELNEALVGDLTRLVLQTEDYELYE